MELITQDKWVTGAVTVAFVLYSALLIATDGERDLVWWMLAGGTGFVWAGLALRFIKNG